MRPRPIPTDDDAILASVPATCIHCNQAIQDGELLTIESILRTLPHIPRSRIDTSAQRPIETEFNNLLSEYHQPHRESALALYSEFWEGEQ